MAYSDILDTELEEVQPVKPRASLGSTLLALEDPTRLIPSIELDVLSDLTTADLGRFQATWRNLSQERRRSLLSNLVEVAEDHVDAYFAPIYLWLIDDDDPKVRAQAIEGLWEDEDVRLINPLIRHLKSDDCRRGACRGGRLAWPLCADGRARTARPDGRPTNRKRAA